ncbi:hypothetical protein GCM10010381_46950 [Streptomyces xantholiticus]|nr:hypothetical protein GCM10010381_46950 [Streptomyces xantholiticus]
MAKGMHPVLAGGHEALLPRLSIRDDAGLHEGGLPYTHVEVVPVHRLALPRIEEQRCLDRRAVRRLPRQGEFGGRTLRDVFGKCERHSIGQGHVPQLSALGWSEHQLRLDQLHLADYVHHSVEEVHLGDSQAEDLPLPQSTSGAQDRLAAAERKSPGKGSER